MIPGGRCPASLGGAEEHPQTFSNLFYKLKLFSKDSLSRAPLSRASSD